MADKDTKDKQNEAAAKTGGTPAEAGGEAATATPIPDVPAGDREVAQAAADAGLPPKDDPERGNNPGATPTAPAPSVVPSEVEARAAGGKRLSKAEKEIAEMPESVRAARVAGTKVDGTR